MNKTLKKILGVSALTAFAVAPVSASNFADTAGHWVAEYLDTAIEAGVIDGTKTNFHPEANITRAALTKMVVNYDNGGENPTAADYESVANFSDVSADAWYYHHVNYAVEEGIIDGSKPKFNPGAAITRAAALKIITVALGVPSDSTKALPFTDVNEGDWFYPYVNDAYNNCIIKDATKFNPGAPITRAAAVKIFVKSLNPGCEAPVTPTEPTTPTNPTQPTEPTTPTTPTNPTNPVSSNTVEVVVNNSIPATSIPKNATNADFLAIDITAGSAEDVKLTGVTAYHTGQGDEADIDSVKVFDGYIQHGTSKSFSGDDDVATINLGSEPIIIPAGTTKTIFIKGDVATANYSVTHGVQILSADGLDLYGANTGGKVQVTGSFPLVGPLREISNFEVGTVTVTQQPVADDTLEVGVKAAELANLKLETGSAEDVFVKSLTVELQGVDDGDIANLFVEVDGKVVSDVIASANSDDVTFDLTKVDPRGVLISDSSTEYLYVKGDLTSEIDDFDNNNGVAIDDISSDLVVIGAKYGFEVKTDWATGQSKLTYSNITFEGGDLEITLDGEVSDIPADKDDVVLGTLTLENFGGEVELQKSFKLKLEATDSGTAGDVLSHIENITLVDTATGRTVLGPVDPSTTTGTTADLNFNDTLVLAPTSKLVLEVQADIKKEAENGEKFKVSYTIDSADFEGGVDLNDSSAVKLKPTAGSVSTNEKTVTLPTVTFSGKSLGGDNVVESAEDVVVWQGTVRANDVEDIKITRLSFTQTGTATTSDVNDYDLYAVVNGEEVALETSASAGATFTFSSLKDGGLTVKAGEEITLVVKANIAANVTTGNKVIVSLDSSEIQAKDEDGDFLVNGTSILPATDIVSGAEFTLVENGTLAVSLDASRTPDSAIALAGEEIPVAVYKFKATDEDIKVEDIVLTVNDFIDANSNGTLDDGEESNKSVESVALYYQDTGTAVLLTSGANATASVSDGKAFFEGLDLTIEEGTDTYIEVRALIDGIDENDSQQTAVSGAIVSIDIDETDTRNDVKGAQSGSAVDNSTLAVDPGNDFTVLNNKVIATEVALTNTTLASGTKEAVKFKLDVQGDNEAKLKALAVNISGAVAEDGNTDTADGNNEDNVVEIETLYLKEGGDIIKTLDIKSGGADEASFANGVATFSGLSEVIKDDATYVVEAKFSNVPADKSVSFEITVNSGTDGITWQDYGTDGNGAEISWIDLGDSSVSRISGSLSN